MKLEVAGLQIEATRKQEGKVVDVYLVSEGSTFGQLRNQRWLC